MKKIIALVLVLMLALSLFTACQGGDQTTTTTTTAADAAQPTDADSDETESTEGDEATDPVDAEGLTPFENEVTLQIPVYDRGVEGVPTVDNNYWTEWMQENFGDAFNIKVEYIPITRSDVMTDYALLAASQTLPTILMEYDYPKVSQWASDGYLTTFDMDEFAAVAPTYYQSMVDNNQLPYSEMNGETYFALAERPFWDTGFFFQSFVRMDWLREVGYDSVPSKYDEFTEAMDKIIEAGLSQHPLGGQMITGVGSDQNYGFRNFPEDETEWAMYSSVALPALGWEPAYKLLKRANFEYNQGYTNPEYYITDAESDRAAFINGDTYRYGAYISANMDWLNAFYAQNPDAELVVEPVVTEPDPEGGTVPAYRADNPFGMIVCFSNFASEDELKAAWMYMEWLSDEDNLFNFQWGVEGENYAINAETGLPESIGDYEGEYKQGFNNNKDYWCIVVEARNAGTAEEIIASVSPKGLPKDFTDEIIENYHRRVKTAEDGYASNDPIFSIPIEAEIEYSAQLVELYKEYRDRLTMVDPVEFDALYEDLSQRYMQAGYQDVIEERKAAFEAGNSTRLVR